MNKELLLKLANYLGSRPWKEVNNLVVEVVEELKVVEDKEKKNGLDKIKNTPENQEKE